MYKRFFIHKTRYATTFSHDVNFIFSFYIFYYSIIINGFLINDLHSLLVNEMIATPLTYFCFKLLLKSSASCRLDMNVE